jgi:CHAT domain-containing protein
MRSRPWRAGLAAFAAVSVASADIAAAQPPRAPTPKEAAAWSALVAKAEAARADEDWRSLEKVTRRRLAIEERAYGPDSAVTASTRSWIAQALARRGRDAEAEPFYREALEINRTALGSRHPETLLAMSNLAGVLERLGRFADAEPLRRELVDASRAVFGPKGAETAAATMAMADLLRAQSRTVEAEPLYREALSIDSKLYGDADPRVGQDLGALAAALDDLGRHGEAEPLHRRSLAIRREAFGERDAATAQAYARVAANLDAQGRHAEAEPLHRLALGVDRDVRGRAHPATAADAAALGANLIAQGRAKEAEPLLRLALKIRRKALGEDHADTGLAYAAVADSLAAQGRTEKAERLHRRALTIIRAAKGERHRDTASAYTALADVLSAERRWIEADPLYRRALEIRRDKLGQRHPATAAAYDALAANQHRLAANAGAEALASKAVAIVRARRSADLDAGGDADGGEPGAALRRARADAESARVAEPVFRRYLRLAWLAAEERPGDLPRLRDAAFITAQDLEVSPAARALAQTTARAALARKAAAGEARVRHDLAGEAHQIERRLVRALPQDDPTEAAKVGAALDAVARELADLDARLERENPRYAETAFPRPLSLAQAQRRLRGNEGLLFIVPTGGDVHVFAVSRQRVAWNRLEGAQMDLGKRIRALRCQVDDAACGGGGDAPIARFDLALAHSLYRDLIAPVDGAFAGVDHLFVTTSGAFAGLPLGLLPTAAPDVGQDHPAALTATAWLADRYALTTLPSIASLRASQGRRTAARWSFVGYGDPAIDQAAADATLPPLPGTADEMRAMARTLGAPSSSLRLGEKATEASIKASPALAKAGVVAIATHGVLSHEIEGLGEPALVLTPPAKPTAKDDGLLTATEAAALDLSADWVILSACNTAGADGTPGADSLSGLARAFLYAGARALLVSHWRVFDDATAALTVQTLAIQKANPRLSKAEALQRAMRVVRTGRAADGSALAGWRPEWAHPAYWAPFVLISAGD